MVFLPGGGGDVGFDAWGCKTSQIQLLGVPVRAFAPWFILGPRGTVGKCRRVSQA